MVYVLGHSQNFKNTIWIVGSLGQTKFKNLQIFYEDYILKITFDDQVQKFADFL
jgi:hypothetical protein